MIDQIMVSKSDRGVHTLTYTHTYTYIYIYFHHVPMPYNIHLVTFITRMMAL